ncbi:hypothetical protein K431DRAFT_303978 [Polychaeton citri CBS 116435]|uniref:Uncharacterized protein n=1 Tax=Polychaeton citri CBS 116435 TaxID=1314669 RepID=A0A9P4UPY7_9PEZI|nr:hypothetical protein K431DRAFT_303978 [Polychaeton citri CBS 116435]
MAQGELKAKKKVQQKPSQRKQIGTRVIKPKKATLVKQKQMQKKHSSGLTAVTEKSLAQKAGHLEILRGGKKDAAKNKAVLGSSK